MSVTSHSSMSSGGTADKRSQLDCCGTLVRPASTGLLRQRGWWKSGYTKTGKGKQALHLWLFRPEAEIAKFERALRWLSTAFTSTLY
eukprot:1398685-Rhodomonas_salina.1